MILAPFIKKFGKRNLVLAGAILTMVAQLTLLAVPANPAFVAAVAAIRGIGKAPLFGCVFTMMLTLSTTATGRPAFAYRLSFSALQRSARNSAAASPVQLSVS